MCSRGACKAEYQRQKIATATGHVVTPYIYGRCDICGRRCRADLGVCQETPRCRTEYNRRFRASHRDDLRAYKRQDRASNPERERARDRKRYVDNRAARLELGRRLRLANPERVREQNRRWRLANAAALREKRREYMARTDRPCRYASNGCTAYAIVNGKSCPVHHLEDRRRQARGKRIRLAEAQAWVCPWCEGALPQDLAGTAIDHIIPVALGGPGAAWNLQVLHGPCNREKWHRLTDQAVALAAEHGIILSAAPAA